METNRTQDLSEFVSSLGGGDGLRVEETLGNGFVRLRVSEAERRQAKHDIRCVEDAVIEMLRNARDAHAQHLFVASSKENDIRSCLIVDDGTGIPEPMHHKVFDARVTTKLDSMHMDRWGVHGRGMALFSIKQNATRACVVASEVGIGSSMLVSFNTATITERADQSTWPTVTRDGGAYEVRGPRNVVRACVEFALETEQVCKVYVGSPSEIIATMRERTPASVTSLKEYAAGDLATIPLVERPSLAQDARELRDIAASLGVEMSERTAHRIIRKEIAPLRNARVCVLAKTMHQRGEKEQSSARTLALTPSDQDELIRTLSRDVSEIMERYYLELVGAPRIRIGKGRIQVSFDYDEEA